MKFTGLSSFLIGILLTLFIFGFTFPLLPKLQFIFTIPSSKSDWFTAMSTLAAAVVALGIAIWGERLKQYGSYKPDIRIINSVENIQETRSGIQEGHTRLIFKNLGKAICEDVEVYVNNIYDLDESRDNFIPVPLSWTHDGRSRRDFHPDQYGYLDFCRIDNIKHRGSFPRLVLVAGRGVLSYEDIYPYTSRLELIVFQKSGATQKFKLFLSWQIGQPTLKIKKIMQV